MRGARHANVPNRERKNIYVPGSFFSLNVGGDLICANFCLALHRKVTMRCVGRRARCTKDGNRNDRSMMVAPDDSVSSENTEVRDGCGMHEFTQK